MNKATEGVVLGEVTNGAASLIAISEPYRVLVGIEGTSDLLFHRWNAEAVEAKGAAAKNSKAKKTDDLESYIYRNDAGELAVPGEYVRQSIITAAKFRQDPRSPRKSAMDLYKAGVQSLTLLATTGLHKWDYEDKRRVVVQRSGVNRTRPALRHGWKAEFEFLVATPEYIAPMDLQAVLSQAGVLVGIADFRPTFGRFAVTRFELLSC